NLATNCEIVKQKNDKANWWKNALPEHMVFEPNKDIPDVDEEVATVLDTNIDTGMDDRMEMTHLNEKSPGDETKRTKNIKPNASIATEVPPGSSNTYQPIVDLEVLIPMQEISDAWITVRKKKNSFSKKTAFHS
ncbi:hypothetical protein KI387_042057, partial [Taxus chinensis]